MTSILWEGLLYSLRFSPVQRKGDILEVPTNFLANALNKIDEEVLGKAREVRMVKDDRECVRLMLKACGIENRAGNYGKLLSILKHNAPKIVSKEEIQFTVELSGDMIIDRPEVIEEKEKKKKKKLAVPQLFKVDRYTGLSSLESTNYFSGQLTIRTSKEIFLLLLLGLCSSFITARRQKTDRKRKDEYFFLTFSPEEIEGMLAQLYEKEYIDRLFRTKEEIRRCLKPALEKTAISEAILLRLFLTVEVERLLEKENLDKLSATLFRISMEDRTYKVYEQIPVGLRRGEYHFGEIMEKYFKSDLMKDLSNFLQPDGVVFDALRNLHESPEKYPEANNVLNAVLGLYKFVTAENLDGLSDFVRELYNAYRKLESSDRQDKSKRCRAETYLRIIKSFSF